MSRVPVTLACWDYDRTRALEDGTVGVPEALHAWGAPPELRVGRSA